MGPSVGLLDVPPLFLVQEMKRQAPFPHSFLNCSKEAIPGNGQLLLQNHRYQWSICSWKTPKFTCLVPLGHGIAKCPWARWRHRGVPEDAMGSLSVTELQDILPLNSRKCWLHLHWWSMRTVFQSWVPRSEVWPGLALEVSSAGHWRITTWADSQVPNKVLFYTVRLPWEWAWFWRHSSPLVVPQRALSWSRGQACHLPKWSFGDCLLGCVSVTKGQDGKCPWFCCE